MKDIRWIPIAFSFLVAFGGRAFAWGQEGHAAVAALAAELISPNTRTKIQELLAKGGDKDLVSAASWADAVLIAAHDEGPLHGNEEAMAFNRKFPKSGMWHFVNFPLGATSYQQITQFDSPDNVVKRYLALHRGFGSPVAEARRFNEGTGPATVGSFCG